MTSNPSPDWKLFELAVAQLIAAIGQGAKVTHDVQLPDHSANANRCVCAHKHNDGVNTNKAVGYPISRVTFRNLITATYAYIFSLRSAVNLTGQTPAQWLFVYSRLLSDSNDRVQSMLSTVSASGTSPIASRVSSACALSHSQNAATSGRAALRGPTISQ